MPIINQIKDLKQKGYSNEQVIQYLKEQGFSPLEISQALDQTEIKAAVSQTAEMPQPQMQTESSHTAEEMQPSLVEQETPELSINEQSTKPAQAQSFEIPAEEFPQEEYINPAPQAYPQEYQYPEYQPAAPETITEIAEQIAEEKTEKIKKQVSEIMLFKETSEKRMKDMDERLKKIENILDNLQAAILGKIGSYGQNLEDIKKEMGMMQDSFSKVLNPLISKVRVESYPEERAVEKPELKKKETKKQPRQQSSDGFEHYLRG